MEKKEKKMRPSKVSLCNMTRHRLQIVRYTLSISIINISPQESVIKLY